MLASSKNGRDNSGHSGHPNKYRGFERPELVSRVFPTRDRKWGQTGGAAAVRRLRPGPSALDCVVPTTRPMSWPERTAAA